MLKQYDDERQNVKLYRFAFIDACCNNVETEDQWSRSS